MATFPPDADGSCPTHASVSYWSIFHDGYFDDVSCDFSKRMLNLEVELAFPKLTNEPRLKLRVEFSRLFSVYCAVSVQPESGDGNFAEIVRTVDLDTFRETVLRERGWRGVIYDASGIEAENGISLFLSVDAGLTINAASWEWFVNDVRVNLSDLQEYAKGEWKKFSGG